MSDIVDELAAHFHKAIFSRETHSLVCRAAARIEQLEAALRATQDYLAFLRRSVNVGPLTNNPSKEATLLKLMMEATDAALAQSSPPKAST